MLTQQSIETPAEPQSEEEAPAPLEVPSCKNCGAVSTEDKLVDGLCDKCPSCPSDCANLQEPYCHCLICATYKASATDCYLCRECMELGSKYAGVEQSE